MGLHFNHAAKLHKITATILGIAMILGTMTSIPAIPNNLATVSAAEIADKSSPSDFVIEDGVLTNIKKVSKHITIPDGVKSIGSESISVLSLYGNENILSVSMPDSVTFVCNQFLRFCDKMTSLRLSKNLTTVEFSAFEGCRSLKVLELPDGITDIPEYCCSSMSVVRYIKLPANLKTIGTCAFSCNPQLKAMYIPASVTSIDPTAFDSTDITLVVNKGSYAESFAKQQGIDFTYREKFVFKCSTSGNGTCSFTSASGSVSNGSEVYTGDTVYVTAEASTGGIAMNEGNRELLYISRAAEERNYTSLKKYPVVLTTTNGLNLRFLKKAASINDALYVSGTKHSYTTEGTVVSDVYRGRTTAHFKSDGAALKLNVNSSKKMYLIFDVCSINYMGNIRFFIDGKETPMPSVASLDFSQQTYEISAGKHTFEWKAYKATSGQASDLDIHIDNVQITDKTNDIRVEKFTTDTKIIDLRINETATISYSIKPDMVATRSVAWSCDETSVAAIKSTAQGKATIQGLARGSANIKATVDGQKIIVPVYVSVFSRIGNFEYNGTSLTWYFLNNTSKVTIPSRTTVVAGHSFDGHSEIKEIIVPDSVNEIEGYAFYECSALEIISIPDTVMEIGRNSLPANKNIVIKCSNSSAALDFAKKYGYKYLLTDGTQGQQIVDAPDVVINSRQITEHTSEIGYYDNYIMSDPEYDYIRDGKDIYRYNIAENKFDKTPIYTSESYNFQTASRRNVLYIKESNFEGTVVTGINVIKNKEVYKQSFDLTENYNSFAVDDEQNFFFSQGPDLFVYDKNGTKISEEVTSTDKLMSGFGSYVISQVDPYNKVLLTTYASTMLRAIRFEEDYSFDFSALGYMYSRFTWIGFKPIRNGKLTSKEYYVKNGDAVGHSEWKFFKNGKYAVNAAGQIVNYKKVTNRKTGIDYDILYTIPNTDYSNDKVRACMYGDVIYVSNSKMKIYAYDTAKKKVLGTYDMSGNEIHALYQIGNATYIRYAKDGKEYIANLKTKEYIEARTIVRKDHITLTYSKADVKKKYQATVGTTFDEKNSYKTKPSYKSPYKAGALSDAVIKQTLTNLNYARWQVGLNSVKTYDKYMERSQKGAVIMAANNMLTHYPSKPSGMSDEFYKEACAGVGADVTYSGNVSWGESLPRSVFGYLSDANNMQAGIGHRINMLDKTVDKTSFGYCNNYSAMSMYYAENVKSLKNNELYYAWPSAGYFPTEILGLDDAWSVSTDFFTTDSPMVTLEYNGNKYEIKGDDLKYAGSSTFYFYIPAKLKNSIKAKSKYEYKSDISVKVSLTGLLDEDGNYISVTYPVKFIAADANANVNKNSAEYKYKDLKNGYVSKDGKAARLGGKLLLLNKTYKDSTGAKYKITKFTTKKSKFISGNVTLISPGKKTIKSFKVPDSIKLNKKTFYVTQVNAKAFVGCKKLQSVSIGKRVVKINASAFSGCKNLKKITINTIKLKAVGKGTFKNINAKAKIYVPKSRLKKYKSLLKNKGLKKTAKILSK